MSLKESFLGNAGNIKKMDPGAELIEVTRSAGSVLAPSWATLNGYKAKKITWDGYIERFLHEMDNPVSRAEMLRIGRLAETKDVYLLCFEKKGNCHRFLLVDMINRLTRGPEAPHIELGTVLTHTGGVANAKAYAGFMKHLGV